MSDEEGGDAYEYEWPSDEEDAKEDENVILLKNTFYEADENKRHKPKEALELYESVVVLEEGMGDEINFRFKALENIVCLSVQLQLFQNMVEKQRALLRMISKVARNDVSDAINNILDAVANHLQEYPDQQREMYQMTLEHLKSNNERLWFNICLRLGKIYLDLKQYEQLDRLLSDLKDNCVDRNTQTNPRLDPSRYDQSKGNLLLEVFALEIQMCTAQKNNQRMKHVYPQTLNLNSVINDPRVLGIIKECGGKMYMSEKRWANALEELFESFKNY